jgi:phenylpyruvate tautomerase PptA (4-oxalocrotonate tautomerase family)
MPIIQIQLNVALDDERKAGLLLSISKLTAEIMQKPISDVMALCSMSDLVMGGIAGPAAFVDFRCISGLTTIVARDLCEGFDNLLKDAAGIDSSRVYINFMEVSDAHAWRFIDGIAVCPRIAR